MKQVFFGSMTSRHLQTHCHFPKIYMCMNPWLPCFECVFLESWKPFFHQSKYDFAGLVWGVIHHASAAAGGTKIHHFVGTEGFCKLMHMWGRRVLLVKVVVVAERKKLDHDENFETKRLADLVFVQDTHLQYLQWDHKKPMQINRNSFVACIKKLDWELRAMMPGWACGQIPRRAAVIPSHFYQKCLYVNGLRDFCICERKQGNPLMTYW